MFGRVLRWVGLATEAPILGTAYPCAKGRALPNIGRIIPSHPADHRHKTARDHADEVAGQFLHWLFKEHPGGCWTSTELYDRAQSNFADATGLKPPPERSLLAAIKRVGGIEHRQDCRLLDDDGRTVRKATLWRFGPVPGTVWVRDLAWQ